MQVEQLWIGGILLAIFVLASITTDLVLSYASSETGDSESFVDTLLGSGPPSKGFHINQDGATNIVLIILDDAGWADFSHHNTDPWSGLETPNMDTILRDGLSFSNFYTQALCTPARGSLMTGRWTWALGLQHLMVLRTCTDAHISWEIPTWAELLKERDYKNYYYGKWHLGMDSWKSTPRGRGWDDFLGSLSSDHGSAGGLINGNGVWLTLNENWDCDLSLADQVLTTLSGTECMFRSYDYRYAEYDSETSQCYSFRYTTVETACNDVDLEDYDTMKLEHEGAYIHLYLDEYSVDWWQNFKPEDPLFNKHGDIILTDKAVKKLEELRDQKQEKWSLVLSYKTSHQDSSFLPHGTNTHIVPACERYFDESSIYYNYDRGAICQQMWQIDEQIGRIISKLEQLKLWDNTLILLTNDNGGTSSQYLNVSGVEVNYNYALNWPLRGVKASYYEGGVKTIMGITGGALPESQRGVVNTDLHHISDITPTILAATGWSAEDMVGVSNGDDFDGIPLYSTATTSSRGHEYIYLSAPSQTGETLWDDNVTAIVLGNGMKMVQYTEDDDLNTRGYWGTLPTEKTIQPTWETCADGCVWDLSQDPYEHVNLAVQDEQPFNELLEEAMASDSWNDGLTFDQASCEDCSMNSFVPCSVDSGIRYLGYLFYPPWLDTEEVSNR